MKMKYLFIIIIFVIVTLNIILLGNSFVFGESKYEEQNKIETNKNFAVMIEKEDETGYIESNNNKWPSKEKYTFNNELSGCIDYKGNKLKNILKYDETTEIVELTINNTAYCYLYFDIKEDKESPKVNAIINNNNSSSPTMTITSNEVGTYCVTTNESVATDCIYSGDITANSSVTTDEIKLSGTYYVYVTDAAGNVGNSTPQSVTIKALSISEYIQSKKPTGYNSTMEGGLYRFQGTTADNYICFGYNDSETDCDFVNADNSDKYAYRIIGINENNQLKLIKKEALNSTMQWWSDYTPNKTWPESTIYSNINGSSFLTNSTYMSSGWSDKIADTNWKYGDNTNMNQTALALYNTENAWTSTTTAKIGLMYAHDYTYGMSGGNDCSFWAAYSTCKTSWLHLSNCDSDSPSTVEWIMSTYGENSNGVCTAWNVRSDGRVNTYNLNSTLAVRPVFYLSTDVKWKSGTGASGDPFIIE